MQGLRGVDLFFMLSGFVLALNYLDEIGPRLDAAKAGRFLWLRLARIWPLYMTVLVVTGFSIVARDRLWGSASVEKLSPSSFLEQLFMVQLWSSPQVGGTSWAGPAWSLSAEWLAYLCFPLLALLVLRMQHRMRARGLFAASGIVLLPLLTSALAFHHFAAPWGWVLRIGCEFIAGMLLCAGVSRLRLTDRQRSVAGLAAIGIVVALVAFFFVNYHLHPRWLGILGTFALQPLVGCLSVGSGPLTRFLSTRLLVLGGGISYGLYLWHSPMLYAFRDVTRYSRLHLDPLPRYGAELAFIGVIVLTAWVTFRFLEEPARRFMRGLLDHQFPPADKPLIPPEPAVRRAS
jgi:peptidoglycan/LPS O-acetylase OafA/YrhL